MNIKITIPVFKYQNRRQQVNREAQITEQKFVGYETKQKSRDRERDRKRENGEEEKKKLYLKVSRLN